jgi:hypothetical protein
LQVDQWLNKKREQYVLNVEIVKSQAGFNRFKYTISDPNHTALNFTLLANENREATAFTTDVFEFKWFNAAEGYTSKTILNAADSCLKGNLTIKRSLTGLKLQFDDTQGKARLKLSNERLSGYTKGYSIRVK